MTPGLCVSEALHPQAQLGHHCGMGIEDEREEATTVASQASGHLDVVCWLPLCCRWRHEQARPGFRHSTRRSLRGGRPRDGPFALQGEARRAFAPVLCEVRGGRNLSQHVLESGASDLFQGWSRYENAASNTKNTEATLPRTSGNETLEVLTIMCSG